MSASPAGWTPWLCWRRLGSETPGPTRFCCRQAAESMHALQQAGLHTWNSWPLSALHALSGISICHAAHLHAHWRHLSTCRCPLAPPSWAPPQSASTPAQALRLPARQWLVHVPAVQVGVLQCERALDTLSSPSTHNLRCMQPAALCLPWLQIASVALLRYDTSLCRQRRVSTWCWPATAPLPFIQQPLLRSPPVWHCRRRRGARLLAGL